MVSDKILRHYVVLNHTGKEGCMVSRMIKDQTHSGKEGRGQEGDPSLTKRVTIENRRIRNEVAVTTELTAQTERERV